MKTKNFISTHKKVWALLIMIAIAATVVSVMSIKSKAGAPYKQGSETKVNSQGSTVTYYWRYPSEAKNFRIPEYCFSSCGQWSSNTNNYYVYTRPYHDPYNKKDYYLSSYMSWNVTTTNPGNYSSGHTSATGELSVNIVLMGETYSAGTPSLLSVSSNLSVNNGNPDLIYKAGTGVVGGSNKKGGTLIVKGVMSSANLLSGNIIGGLTSTVNLLNTIVDSKKNESVFVGGTAFSDVGKSNIKYGRSFSFTTDPSTRFKNDGGSVSSYYTLSYGNPDRKTRSLKYNIAVKCGIGSETNKTMKYSGTLTHKYQ